MDAFTAGELTTLRSQPQSFRPKLAIYNPATTWSGTLNGAHDKGSRTLTVITVTGDTADIIDNSVLLVGEGVNQRRVRIKTASGSTLTLSENSLDFDDGDLLEALLYIEPTPIFHRIVNHEGIVEYFEDFDTEYTDQNLNLSPVVNYAPAAIVVELGASGSFADLDLDTADSFVFGSTLTGYQWAVNVGAGDLADAEIIGSSTSPTVKFRFWNHGDFYISCQITAANGKSSIGYRPVMVRRDVDGIAGSPIFDFEIDSLSGSRDDGAWRAELTIFEDINLTSFPRNMPLVVYGNVTYGQGVGRSTDPISWHYDATSHQRFAGWAREEIWVEEYKDKGVGISISALGLGAVLQELRNYPAWLRFSNNPSDWTGMVNLSVDRMLYFYLKNRTTVLQITDWHRTGDNRLMNYAELPEGDIFSGVNNFLIGTIFGEAATDRNSALWTEFDAQMVDDSTRAGILTDVQSVTDADHMNEISLPTTRDRPEVSWLSIDGLYFDGVQNLPIISYAPGYVISPEGGEVQKMSGLVLESTQADLNITAGRLYALRNNPMKSIQYVSQGTVPHDIAPQASMRYSGLASGTFREETITDADLMIRAVEDQFFSGALGMTSTMELEITVRDEDAIVGPNVPTAVGGVEGFFPPPAEVFGIDPGDYEFNWGGWPGWDFDVTVPTSLNPPPPAVQGEPLLGDPLPNHVAIFSVDNFIYFTSNFQDASPNWDRRAMNLSVGDTFHRMDLDYGSPLYQSTGFTVNAWVIGQDKIYHLTDIFETEGSMTTTAKYTFREQNLDNRMLFCQESAAGRVCVASYYDETGSKGTWVAATADNGDTWAEVQVTQFLGTAATTPAPGECPGVYWSTDGSDTIFVTAFITPSQANPVAKAYESTDDGATWALAKGDAWGVLGAFRWAGYDLHYYDHTAHSGDHFLHYGRWAGDTSSAANKSRGQAVSTGAGGGTSIVGSASPPPWNGPGGPHTNVGGGRYRVDFERNASGSSVHGVAVYYDSTSDDWKAGRGVVTGGNFTIVTEPAPSEYRFVRLSSDYDGASFPDIKRTAFFTGINGAIGITADASIADSVTSKKGDILTKFPSAGDFHFMVTGG